jgi:hypothetical protein
MITPRDLAVPLERITWRSGQTLTARDLRDDEAFLQQLRHLHIRYQHKTWGVVLGLGVHRAGAGLSVTPGYALDIEGRELLWPRPGTVAAPGTKGKATMYLAISYPAPTDCAATPDLRTLCFGRQNLADVVTAGLAWKTVDEVRPGLDVLLARVLVENSRVVSAIDTSVQRFATVMYRPLFWADTTQPGHTGWQNGTQDLAREIQATVDTTGAGFVSTPAYFALVTATTYPVAAFISEATPTSFTFVARGGFQSSDIAAQSVVVVTDFNAAAAEKAGWTISWFGIEMPQG